MNQHYFTWTLASTLFITLYILGFINTASGLTCYDCGGGTKCPEGERGEPKECGGETNEFACFVVKNAKSDNVGRGCTHRSKVDDFDCDEFDDEKATGDHKGDKYCFCKTNYCNDHGNGCSRLGQMSMWIFLAFPVLVTWMSDCGL